MSLKYFSHVKMADNAGSKHLWKVGTFVTWHGVASQET